MTNCFPIAISSHVDEILSQFQTGLENTSLARAVRVVMSTWG